MLVVIIVVALFILILWAFIHKSNGDSSRYEKSKSFMDFDAGVDSDKVGDPKYPTDGVDSVMKHEYLDDLMKDKKD